MSSLTVFSKLCQRQLNELALNDPEPGDYWYKNFKPFFMVLNVTSKEIGRITVLTSSSLNGNINALEDLKYDGWRWNFEKFQVVSKEWMLSQVFDDSNVAMPLGTSLRKFCADVRRDDHNRRLAEEWKQQRAKKLIQELKDLGPSVSWSILKNNW